MCYDLVTNCSHDYTTVYYSISNIHKADLDFSLYFILFYFIFAIRMIVVYGGANGDWHVFNFSHVIIHG